MVLGDLNITVVYNVSLWCAMYMYIPTRRVLVQDNPFLGVTLTPKLTPHLGSFLLPKKSSFYSQSGVKITPKMGLFVFLAWVVFALLELL